MKKSSNEALKIARYINTFLNDYAHSQRTRSEHTLKSYNVALTLYLGFLETEKGSKPTDLCGELFTQPYIEEWLLWLMEKRKCSPETCNLRLASLRAFLYYLGEHEVSMLHLTNAASKIKRKKVYRKKVSGMSKEAVKALLSRSGTTRRDATEYAD